MPELVIARLLHVLGVVLWVVGGVALVTTVLLPATRRLKTPQERIEFFETVERGFALQALSCFPIMQRRGIAHKLSSGRSKVPLHFCLGSVPRDGHAVPARDGRGGENDV